jgi:DNA primase
MRFSSDFIDRVRDASNIVDVLSEYTQLKRNGHRLTGLCPFPGHKEKTPSFNVSEDKQVYHCFGCKQSGQVFTALQELKGFSFPEAVEYLAKRSGIPIPRDELQNKVDEEKRSRRETLNKINSLALKHFQQNFQQASTQHPVRNYALKRGLTQSILSAFKIGYASPEWEALAQTFFKHKAPMGACESLGLIRARKDKSGHFDLFRDRMMFPILNLKEEVVGFGGRSLSDEQQPKYLNSPESEMFHKGKILYGLYETAKFIKSEDRVLVVEGYMDFLGLYAAGIKNVVATLGTALTSHHCQILKRYTANIVLLFDGDRAGQAAMERSLPILLAEDVYAKALTLPKELDPDEYVKAHGAQALTDLLKGAPDLFSLVFDQMMVGYHGTPSEKVTILNKLSEILSLVFDSRLRDLYLGEVAQKLSLDPRWLAQNLRVSTKRTETPISVTQAPPVPVLKEGQKVKIKGAPKAELILLNIALLNQKRFDAVVGSGVVPELTDSGVMELFMLAESIYRQMPSEFAKLTGHLMTKTEHPEELGLHLGDLASMPEDELSKLTDDCLRQIRQKFLRNRTRELTAQLRNAPVERQLEQMEELMKIQKDKHSLKRDRESQT